MDNDHGITDELRRYASYAATDRFRQSMLDIADRIDAAHERAVMSAMNDALYQANDENMAELGWVKLPVDADGKPWHIGDFTESGQLVYKMYLDVNGWSFYGLVNDIDPSIHRHYHEDTWERIIEDACKRAVDGYPDETGVIATSDLIERCKALAAEGGDAK